MPLSDLQGLLQITSDDTPALLPPNPALSAISYHPDSDIEIETATPPLDSSGPRHEVQLTWGAVRPFAPVFYQIVKANPSRSEILHMAPNAKQLTASHQIVQLHLQLEHSERWKSNREILVAVDPVKPSVEKTGFHSFGLDLQRVDDDMLLSGWFCWDILPQHEFILLDTLDLPDLQGKDLCKFAPGDSTPQAMGLIRPMVNAQAFAKTENVFVIGSRGSSQWDDLQRAYLETLKAKGFVIAMDDQELSWQLTESGRRRIHACSVLTNKRSVGHARSPPGSKFDWTLHEMVSNLEGAGWNVVRERQKESARRALTLSQDLWAEGPADQKRIYFEKSLGKKYLLVLLHLKELFAVGVTEVFHGQPAGYYSRFFDNKGSPKKPAEQAEEGADSIMDIELEVVEADPPKIPPRRGKRARVAREDAGALPPLPPDPLTSIVLPPSSATQTRRRQAEIAPALADEDHEGDNDVIMESILAHFEFADENPDNPSQAPSSSAVVEATSHSAGGGGEVAEPVLELPEAEESNVEAASSSKAARPPRSAAADVVGFWFDDPVTEQAHKFTFKASSKSWQVRCSYHDAKVNPSGSKTHCTRTMPVPAGENQEVVLEQLKKWVAAAPQHASKASHQAMFFRAEPDMPPPKAQRKSKPKPKPSSVPPVTQQGSSSSSTTSKDSSSSSNSSSSSSESST